MYTQVCIITVSRDYIIMTQYSVYCISLSTFFRFVCFPAVFCCIFHVVGVLQCFFCEMSVFYCALCFAAFFVFSTVFFVIFCISCVFFGFCCVSSYSVFCSVLCVFLCSMHFPVFSWFCGVLLFSVCLQGVYSALLVLLRSVGVSSSHFTFDSHSQ